MAELAFTTVFPSSTAVLGHRRRHRRLLTSIG
jgi:hypothetical protein